MTASLQIEYAVAHARRAFFLALLMLAQGCVSSPLSDNPQNVGSRPPSQRTPLVAFGGEESKAGIFVWADDPIAGASPGRSRTIPFRIWNGLDRPVLLMIDPVIVSLDWAELTVQGHKQSVEGRSPIVMTKSDWETFVLLKPSPSIQGRPAKYPNSIYATAYTLEIPETPDADAIDFQLTLNIKYYVVGSNELASQRLTRQFHIPFRSKSDAPQLAVPP